MSTDDKSANVATLATSIKAGVDGRLKHLHTALPGLIESFDSATQLATVQPAIRRVFIDRTEGDATLVPTDLPVLINVPVIFPRGGGFSLTFPVLPGDECLVVFCERSIDRWHASGGVQDPGAKRFHALSDATAFVGLSSTPLKIPDYDSTNVQLKRDDGSVSFTLLTDGTARLEATTSVTVNAPDTEVTGNLKVGGTLEVIGPSVLSGTVTSGGVDISMDHEHSGSPTAPDGPISDTGAPT